jgi:hypothetical protein
MPDARCEDVLLLALTPPAYNSNDTADTPGNRAVSPAQVRLNIHSTLATQQLNIGNTEWVKGHSWLTQHRRYKTMGQKIFVA